MTSERTILSVIISILLVGVASVICGAVLAFHGKADQPYLTVAGAAIGVLGAILAKTDSHPSLPPVGTSATTATETTTTVIKDEAKK